MNKKAIPLPSDVEYITAIDDLSFAKNVIPQLKYMNFIFALHIEHFELTLSFMGEEDFPICKLGKLE